MDKKNSNYLALAKRNVLFSAIALSAVGAASAEPLTPEQSKHRVFGKTESYVPMKVAGDFELESVPEYTALTSQGNPAAYVFNVKGGGYMILSGDDVAFPVLGYSDAANLDEANMPPALVWWLGEYARQIEYASRIGAVSCEKAPEAPEDWTEVPVLMTTRWNQDAPYSNDCPVVNGRTCVTGCVATSMAQVMNYFKYPDVGEGSVSFYSGRIGQNLSMNFGEKAFDWDNMLNFYEKDGYSETQADAVAYLMKACGYSVEMSYSPDLSGASGESIAYALREYFKYDEGCRSIKRMLYSWEDWRNMIYGNLKDVGPVVINGQSPQEGGHSFVCDGYSNGYFHSNWGWGGMADGYYALDALNPTAQGIGGYEGGFNFHQNAIIGAQKPTGKPAEPNPGRLLIYGALSATVDYGELSFVVSNYSPCGWGNATDHDIKVRVGAIYEPVDGTPGETEVGKGKLSGMSSVSLQPGSYYASGARLEVKIPELQNGKYKVTVSSMEQGIDGADWLPAAAPWGYPNYVYLEVNDGTYTVINSSPAMLDFSDMEVLTSLFNSRNAKFRVKVSNPSDVEITRGASPMLMYNGKRVMVGGSFLVTLKPGETIEKEWVAKFLPLEGAPSIKEDTEFTIGMYDPETNLDYGTYGTVVMQPTPARNATVSLTGFSIEGSVPEPMTIDGREFPNVQVVKDGMNMDVKFGIKISRGYYDGQLTMGVYEAVAGVPTAVEPVIESVFSETPFLEAGSERSYEVHVDFDQAQRDKLYYLRLMSSNGSSMTEVARLPFMWKDLGAVEGIYDESSLETRYYNLQGVEIDSPRKGDLVIVRRGNGSVKIIY